MVKITFFWRNVKITRNKLKSNWIIQANNLCENCSSFAKATTAQVIAFLQANNEEIRGSLPQPPLAKENSSTDFTLDFSSGRGIYLSIASNWIRRPPPPLPFILVNMVGFWKKIMICFLARPWPELPQNMHKWHSKKNKLQICLNKYGSSHAWRSHWFCQLTFFTLPHAALYCFELQVKRRV